MTFRDWFNDLGEAGEAPSLVSLAVFAAIFITAIFLVGLSEPFIAYLRDLFAGVSGEIKAVVLTVFILGLMAIARIVQLLTGGRKRIDSA